LEKVFESVRLQKNYTIREEPNQGLSQNVLINAEGRICVIGYGDSAAPYIRIVGQNSSLQKIELHNIHGEINKIPTNTGSPRVMSICGFHLRTKEGLSKVKTERRRKKGRRFP
jgi:hypothetical protein